MPDYSKTQQYRLDGHGLTYIGHTTVTLEERKKTHITDANSKRERHCTSKQIVDAGDFEISRLEYYPCANKTEAEARERWWIEKFKNDEQCVCINKHIPGRTMQEWYQDNKEKYNATVAVYQKANKEKIAVLKKKLYEKNREKRLAYQKAYKKWNKDMQGLNRIDITD